MPRRRHDTSSDDSDSSGSDSSDAGSRRQSRQQKNRSDRQSSSVSPEEKKKIVLKQKKPKSDSDSSPERSRSRKRTKTKQRHDSSSDSDQRSPVKKSVVSKVEKAKDKSGKSKKDKNKTDKTDKRQLSEPEISPDKKRARGRDSSLPKSGKGGKTSSNANRSLQSSQSPERRQRSDERIPRRDFKQNRSLSRDRNDSREPLRGQQSWSSDQNVGRYQGRDDRDWNIGRRSPDRRFPNDQRFPDRRLPERMSPDRRFPDRMSPDRQYYDRRSQDRRFPGRRFPEGRSPDRRIPDIISSGRRFPDRRSPNRRFPDRISPDRGGHGWNDRATRDRFDNGPRAMDSRQEARSRSFERHPDQRARSFERGNISGDRTKDQSGSPQKGRQRNDSYRSEDREIENGRRRGDFSDIQKDKRGKKNRSVSMERKRNNKSKSPDSFKKAVKVQARSASVENEKSKKDKNEDKNDRKKDKKKANTDSDVEKLVSKKKDKIKNTKEKSSKKTKDNSSEKNGKKSRDDSLERSFERSKNSISFEEFESSHSRSMEVSDESPKKTKKTGSKRQRSASISESESPRQGKKQKDKSTGKRAKKNKDKDVRSRSKSVEKLFKKKGKKVPKSNIEKRPQSVSPERSNSSSPQKYSGNKKQKMSKRKSRSRSLSPLDRSNELERSTSSDVSVGKNHDLARFESDPESGEITDSDEDAENKQQTVKSFIKKPADEEIQSADDEKYWNDKRKGAKHVEEEPNKRKDVLPHKEKDHIQRKDKDRGSKRKAAETKDPEPVAVPEEPVAEPAPKKPQVPDGGVAALTGRTGGAYIPPARLRAMQASITDKSSVEYQRISWEALKKSINGLVNKVNVSNIEYIVREMFQENIVRGRGLMARSIIQAQAVSSTFTHVYAALVAVVNTKFPQNGELLLRRLITQFRRGYKRNNKSQCISSTRFVAHLVNQQVAHEILALEILTLLLEKPTDDSVEVAVGFLKEVGQKLTEVSPRGINAIFDRLRTILHEGQIDTRVQYMVEVMYAVRKDNFKDFQSVLVELDLVEEEDQFTHLLTLEDAGNPEDILNVFKADPDFQENEEKYKILKKEILDEGSEDEDGSGSGDSGSDDDSDDEEDKEAEEAKQQLIIDQTETNMVALRRTIYLTIQSSLDFEECAHKLMKMELKPGQEVELCNMIQDCCAQMRTYEKFFGLLAGRFCMIDKKYVQPFQVMFGEQYNTIHRLETNKLRNIAKFFAHLLHTDSISWAVLECIKLNEDDTTSASRIFIKILFQELSEYLGLPKLNDRLKDVTLQEYFTGLLPRDNPRDTRFAINFFTTIGLGGLTDDLRDHLKNVSKKLMQQKKVEQQTKDSSDEDDDDDDSDSSSSDESSDDSDSESSNSDSSDSSDDGSKKKKRKGHEKPTERETEKRKNIKGKKTVEKEKTKDKKGRKDKDQTNGANSKLDRKKDKKEEKKKEKERWKEEQAQKEREENFKRLSKLANYGDVPVEFASDKNDAGTKRSGKTDKGSRKTKSNKNKQARDADSGNVERKRSRNDSDRDGYSSRDGNVFSRERDQFDARPNLDRSYDSSFDSRDERNDGRRGKKGRDFIEVERDDRPIRIERNFERLDIYEDKFARERERNLDFIRGREEYEDYYRGRGDLIRGGFVDPRDPRDGFRGPARGRGNMDDARFEGMYRERDLDRGFDEGRRRGGRMRSEERAPTGRDERRRRR